MLNEMVKDDHSQSTEHPQYNFVSLKVIIIFSRGVNGTDYAIIFEIKYRNMIIKIHLKKKTVYYFNGCSERQAWNSLTEI